MPSFFLTLSNFASCFFYTSCSFSNLLFSMIISLKVIIHSTFQKFVKKLSHKLFENYHDTSWTLIERKTHLFYICFT